MGFYTIDPQTGQRIPRPDITYGTGRADYSQRGIHGPPRTESYTYGDDYGTGPYGLPIMRYMRDGRPAGYMVNYGGSWMDMSEFNDPAFQQYFVGPEMQRQGSEEMARFRTENPGVPTGALGGDPGFQPGGGRGAGPVGSRSQANPYAQFSNLDPAIIQQLIGA